MSIKKQFGGATIRKAGAYSQSKTNPESGSQSAVTGVILLVGESDAGPSGATEGLQKFSAAAFNQLKQKYRSGPLVDAAKAALVPSRTPGVNGAGTFWIWKTNAALQASLALANSYDTLKAREYGIDGNRITYKNSLSAESEISVTGSAAVTAFGALDTQTLILRQNGGAPTTVTFSAPADMSAVLSQINAQATWVTASSVSGKLKITMNAASNHHRDGWGRAMEIQSGSALANLFLVPSLATPASEPRASLEIIQPRDSITETGIVGGDIVLQLSRDSSGSCTAATIAIDATNVTLVQTGATPASITLPISQYPLIGNLVDAINALSGWSASCPAAMRTQPTSSLDEVSATGTYSTNSFKPGRIKRDANAIANFYSASQLVESSGTPTKGLPDAEGRLNLSGGARGASASSNFDDGMSAALAEEINVMLPCVSQDASVDITAGETDPSSTYDIETVQAMLDTQLRLRGNIKNKKECQGFTGYRKQKKADVYEQSAKLGSELIQLCMEDVLVVDSTNNLNWKQPHIEAALMAGIRLGTEIGEPLTHKVLNCQGVGHFVNPSTGVVGGDYNPQIDYDDAIDAGVTSAEPAAGAFRVMMDNTTYGADESFVFNRGSVMEASQYIAKTIRTDAESAFVGKKNSVVTASSIKNRIRSKLTELFNAKITSPSDDAPQGFVEDTLIVTVTGNTAEVQVEVKPVQGLDFIFITFTLGETKQSA